MTSPDVITPSTNNALRDAAAKYSATVAVPCYLGEVDGFAGAHLGETTDGLSTLITGTPDSLAVSVNDGEDNTRLFVNIDLDVPGEEVAAIVEPGFYNEKGEPDTEKGKKMRPVVRLLTELEGRELTMDLHSTMAKIPADRRKN